MQPDIDSPLKPLSIKPFNVKGKLVSLGKVKITWQFNDDNCCYCEIGCKKNGRGGWQQEVTEEPTTSHMLEIDDSAMTYSIRVRSVLAEKLGLYSDTVEVTIKKEPQKPNQPEPKSVTSDSITIQWSDDDSEGIDFYEVHYRIEDAEDWTETKTTGGQCQHSVEGLQSGREYTFKVRGVNDLGKSEHSVESDRIETKKTVALQVIKQETQMPYNSKPIAFTDEMGGQRTSSPSNNTESSDQIKVNMQPDMDSPLKPLSIKPSNVKGKLVPLRKVNITWQFNDDNCDYCEIRYKKNGRGGWQQAVTEEPTTSHMLEIDDSAMTYSIRVRSVLAERLGPYSDTVEVTINKKKQKPNEPQQPKPKSVTSDSIIIQWSDDDSEEIDFYEVHYRIEDAEDWTVTKTTGGQCQHSVEGLQSGREYTFKVRGVNDLGKSEHSIESDRIETKKTAARLVMEKAEKITKASIQPAQYRIKMTKTSNQDKSEQIQHLTFGSPSQNHPSEKTIMVFGATGSGKSTLINGMLNYLLGVKWEDDFRFIITNKDAEKTGASQAHSQTQHITCYKIHAVDGSRQTYTLNIVDTPGFGDTSVIARDKELVELIRTLFGKPGNLSLQTIDAVCFVAQAGQARLTPTQRYIFDSVLSMFGKNIAENIVALITFADGSKPPVLVSLKEAEVPFADHFTFNNSALFESNFLAKSEPGNKSFCGMFWDMGIQSFQQFFDKLGHMSSKSLTLSAEVLEERKHLEAKVEGLQLGINDRLNKVETLRRETETLEKHKRDIDENKNFKYTVDEVRQFKVDLDPGKYVTNCLKCNRTCHSDCGISDDNEKYRCAAMDWTMEPNDRKCEVCDGKCIWTLHVNNPYRFDFKTVTIEKTYDDRKAELLKATGKSNKQLDVVGELNKEIIGLEQNISNTVSDITNALHRLNEIALKPNPLNNIDYIDLLLIAEEQEKKEGYMGRIVALNEVRVQAVTIQKGKSAPKLVAFFQKFNPFAAPDS